MLDTMKQGTMKILERIFGSKYERDMRRLGPIVREINEHFEEYKTLSEDQLRSFTQKFREELAGGADLEDILPRAFAVVKEACRRHLGRSWDVVGMPTKWEMVSYDLQLA